MKDNPIDPYREWNYADRRDARYDEDQRDNCRKYDRDSESSDMAYDSWRRGGDFSDPNPEGRFH